MVCWILVISAVLVATEARFSVNELTTIGMNEQNFTIDAINVVFAMSGTLAPLGIPQRLQTRGRFLECINRLDSRSCIYLMQLGACNTNYDSMRQFCGKTCGFCTDPPCYLTRYGCCFDGKTISTGPHMQGCEDDCKDAIGKIICRSLKKTGRCFQKSSVMRKQCAITCGYCRPCIDEEPYQCRSSSKYDVCSSGKGGILENCRKTCNKCGKKDPCFNHPCPKNSVCHIGENKLPYCECDGNCNAGDHFTGVVCARDGMQYKNLCVLKKRNCGHPAIPPIATNHYGFCRPGVAFTDKRRICSKTKKESRMCHRWVSLGHCQARRKAMQQFCPRACNFCSLPSPKPSCHYMKYGCCLDNHTPSLNTNCKGCPKFPECKDFSKPFCRRFVTLCGVSKHMKTMKKYCPRSCHFCVKTATRT